MAEDKNELAEDRTDFAEDRTDLAEDRTVLANERTYAGWMRTGFAAIGIALGFNALFARMEPDWIPKAIATAFLLIGMAIFVAAERRACSIISRLNTHQVQTVKIGTLRLITVAVVVATLALTAAMWLLKIEETGGS